MGQRYHGPNQAAMLALVENSREFIDHDILQRYPLHNNWFHMNFQGLHYHFYATRNAHALPSRLIMSLAVHQIRDELFAIENDHQDDLREYFMPDGSLAARTQIFNLELDLEEMPPTTRIYKHWLYFGHEHPQFANVLIILA